MHGLWYNYDVSMILPEITMQLRKMEILRNKGRGI